MRNAAMSLLNSSLALHLVLLQETKFSAVDNSKYFFSFMPHSLQSFHFLLANGSAGGLISAWDDSIFSRTHFSASPSTLSIHLSDRASNLVLCITNVYAPSSPDLRPAFLDEFKSIAPTNGTPWLVCGDFNMIRYATEKTTVILEELRLKTSMTPFMIFASLNFLCWTISSLGRT